jgi:hypothetical protein
VENMTNSTKGGEFALRKLGGVLSFPLLFHLSFAAFLPILEFCGFLLLDYLFLSLSFFCHSLVLHLILNPKFKLCIFGVANVLIKEEIEKVICSLVYLCDE